jgi:hypothetical protein
MKRIFLISIFSFALGHSFAQEAEPSINEPTWEIRCYPNPTSDLLVIESSKDIKEVTLIDLNGQLIKAPAMSNWCYSLHDLPTGWIFVYIENSDGQIEKKNVYKQ